MVRIPRRWRELDRAEGPWTPPPIGHNQGPPLDQPTGGWARHCWRQAHKKAWRSPPLEVVRLRAARAAELGLSYHDYSAILLDRGGQPKALIFDLGGTLVATRNDEIETDRQGRIRALPGVIEKLSALRNCRVFVVTNQAGVAERLITAEQAHGFIHQLNALCGGIIMDHRICMEPAESDSPFRKPQPGMVLDLLAAHHLTAGAAVMIGDSESDRRCAEAARLARFLWAWDYFGR